MLKEKTVFCFGTEHLNRKTRGANVFRKRKIVSYTILALAMLILIVGVVQGGYLDTLQRAIVTCLECIGIG